VTLTAADVAEIMRLVEQSGFDELTLEIDGMKLSLRRGAPGESSAGGTAQVSAEAVPVVPVAVTSGASAASAPRPAVSNAPPFVEVGASVDEQTVVAIIEVMKLMNTVRAGVRGTVTEILLGDGALAEYGETLLRVRKSG